MKSGSATSTHAWREILEVFEQWQSLPADGREAWLARLQAERPGMHCRLTAIIEADERAAAQGFLDEDLSGPLFETEVSTDRKGMALGSWVLQEPIGRGGMGEVWLATRSDQLYSGRAAVKLVNTLRAGAEADARFGREGELLGRLAHPRIAQLFDAGHSQDGTRYLIMEYVQGKPLDQACEDARLNIEARLKLFLQVCEAVSYAHTQQIIHRDLKPANILVTADSHVKLLDFGVAKLLDDEANGRGLTRAGVSWFTLEYGAPEQITNEPITTATDVYSLGVILFELLCGGRPHRKRATLYEAVANVVEPPLTLREALASADLARVAAARSTTVAKLRQTLSKDLQVIVAKSLKPSPNERYDTAQALADDLRRYLEQQPVRAQPDSWSYRTRKFIERNRVQTVTAAVAVSTLLLGVIMTSWQWREAVAETRRKTAVIDVFKSIFSKLPPNQSPTTQISASEMLRRGWREASRQTAADPELRAAIAEPMGMLLMDATDWAMGAEALTVARQYMRDAGQTKTAKYTDITLKLAMANGRMGNIAVGKELLNETVAMTTGSDINVKANLLARLFLADIARTEGRLEAARADFARIAAEAKRLGTNSFEYRTASEELAETARRLGSWKETDELLRTNPKPERLPTQAFGVQELNAAILDYERGRFAAAAATLQPLCAAAEKLYSEQSSDKIAACAWSSRAEFECGRLALSDAAMATARSWANQSQEPSIRGQVEMVLARQLVRSGRLAEAEPIIRKTLPYFESLGPLSRSDVERLRVTQAELLLRDNQASQALTLLQDIRSWYQQVGYQRDSVPMLQLRAVAADLAQGTTQSLALYREARDHTVRFFPEGHPDRFRAEVFLEYAHFRQAPSLEVRQRLAAAIQAYRDALKFRSDFQNVYTLTEQLTESAAPAEARVRLLQLLDY